MIKLGPIPGTQRPRCRHFPESEKPERFEVPRRHTLQSVSSELLPTAVALATRCLSTIGRSHAGTWLAPSLGIGVHLPARGKHDRAVNQNSKYASESIGADAQTRTADLRITNALLYQLSYIGLVGHAIIGTRQPHRNS